MFVRHEQGGRADVQGTSTTSPYVRAAVEMLLCLTGMTALMTDAGDCLREITDYYERTRRFGYSGLSPHTVQLYP